MGEPHTAALPHPGRDRRDPSEASEWRGGSRIRSRSRTGGHDVG